MDINSFRPAHEFALQYGVKSVVYGKPGSGKSPICITTSPRACVLMCEPGFLSLRKSSVLTYPAFTPEKIEEFFLWAKSSKDADQFDTFVIDSISQMSEIILERELGGTSKQGNDTHGQRAYGKMSRKVMEYLGQLYFMPRKHIVLVAKMQSFEVNSMIYRRPYFPGRELPVKVPHLFDLVMELGDFNVPGEAVPQKRFCTKERYDAMGRDRSGMLEEFELPNMGDVIKRASV